MVHWIAPGPAPRVGPYVSDVDGAVEGFNLDGLINQIRQTSASWLIFTIGQNTGYYASPNQYMANLGYPHHCSNRDLILELCEAIQNIGLRFIAYLPGEIKAVRSLHEGFSWNPLNQSDFQIKYTSFIKEYSDRYGSQCDGWWIDGCYDWKDFPNSTRDWDLWARALRSGNSNSALSFNDGCYLIDRPLPLTVEQDFLSGEAQGISLHGPIGVGSGSSKIFEIDRNYSSKYNCQPHVVCPIDSGGRWGHSTIGKIEPPLYQTDFLKNVVDNYSSSGYALTLNVGIYQDGLLGEETVDILSRI